MLGLLFIYLIGKQFYELAARHNKSRWGFAIAGVASYYFGTFIAGIVMVIYLEVWTSSSIEDIDDFMLNLIALPFGALACFGFYKILERNWERKTVHLDPDILDEEFTE